MTGEIVLAFTIGAIIAVARWREYQWRRSPLGQATAVLERAQRARLRRRDAVDWHPLQWLGLAVVCGAFLAWAGSAFIAELAGAARLVWRGR